MRFRTRFAPSPTGPLHLGHAYSALLAHDMAAASGGEFLLRIEDIDQSRCRAEWEALIYEDLRWLGVSWPVPVMRQSARKPAYQAVLQTLWTQGVLFACTCNRRDIEAAATAPQEGTAPRFGPDGIVYPGTCRTLSPVTPAAQLPETALRLRMADVAAALLRKHGNNRVFSFVETGSGPNGETGEITFDLEHLITAVGDIVLARRDMGTSYHLSVVLDDAAQDITHVVRGQDLFEATKIHVVLQQLLGLPTPVYHHHRLIRDAGGKRLAKRDDARAIRKYREDGKSAADIRGMVGLEHRGA